jgi:hypothetical protein
MNCKIRTTRTIDVQYSLGVRTWLIGTDRTATSTRIKKHRSPRSKYSACSVPVTYETLVYRYKIHNLKFYTSINVYFFYKIQSISEISDYQSDLEDTNI